MSDIVDSVTETNYFLIINYLQVSGRSVPKCTGTCLIYCANQWNTNNYWPHECIGKELCTCGKEGAICK